MAARKPKAPPARAAEPSAPTRPPSAVGEFLAEFRVPALVLLLLLATAATWGQFDFRDSMGYHGLFADALLAGQLSLLVTPEQANLTDMIPYQGRYYFQWGPLPAVFHLALRPLGIRLTDRVFCLAVGWLTALGVLAIAWTLGQRHFPGLPRGAYVWFLFAFALGTPALLVTARGVVYNESIGFAALAVVAAFLAFLVYQRRPSAGWALAMGAGIGAAGATRVSTIFYAVPFFLGLAWWERLDGRPARAILARLVLFSLPVVAAGGLHMANNQARFGSPFDFGRAYKPESAERPDLKPFSVGCIPENAVHYFFSLPEFSRDFPWVAHVGRQPYGCALRAEALSSILLAGPFLLLGLFAWPALKPGGGASRELRFAVGLAAASSVATTLTMLAFAAASRRYAQDFLPLAMPAVFAGLAWLMRGGETWARWRPAAWAVLVWSALWNLHTPFYQSFYTPTPDLNAMRLFVRAKPLLDRIAPGPNLDEQAAIAANDWASLLMNERRFAEAAEKFERAAEWMPGNERIRQNAELARRLAGAR